MDLFLSVPYPLRVGGASFTFCCVVCLWESKHIFGRFESYKNAPESTRKNWNVRFVSTLHAIVEATMSTSILLNNWDAAIENPIWSRPYGAQTALSIMIGYMFADLLMLATYFWEGWQLGLPDIVHHITAIIVGGSVLKYNYIYPVALVRAWSGCSTPFVHIEWFMMKSDMVDNKWYLRNGLVLAVIFFFCRIFVMPYLYIINFLFIDEVAKLGHLQWLIFLGIANDILNLVWFHKIVSLIWQYLKAYKKE